ncbi:small kinetochore-associated protein isoform X2 [Petaurus breviceps papuanus]|uniref:small kinetochore-associated protein isoform X2 n=1 Tax=Petaurus breviceps papuanus TaxID=3040969 RepID=UPI0036DF798D
MESGSRLGAGDLASAVERPGWSGLSDPQAAGALETWARAQRLMEPRSPQGPARSHFQSQHCQVCVPRLGPLGDAGRRSAGRQMKTMDPAAKKNIKKSYTPLNRQKAEEELKEKNQLLEAVNRQLYLKLTESQGELKVLTQKVELLEKSQDNYLAILENGTIDPVTGRQILENRQETMKCQMESVLLLESLKDELKLFNQTATKQMEELQALKVKLKMEEEERTGFLEKRAAFHNKRDDFTAILEQMEQLLSL